MAHSVFYRATRHVHCILSTIIEINAAIFKLINRFKS